MSTAAPPTLMREVLALLGGLLLEGAATGLLDELRAEQVFARSSSAAGGPLGAALGAAQASLDEADSNALATEYTRLFILPAGGPRGRLVIPPWEDCWLGEERTVLGERSRAAMLAYAGAGIGFDAMDERPSDHLGLELCFVSALLVEEEAGERDGAARRAFVREHVQRFAPLIGAALARESREPFWRALGDALTALPDPLARLDAGALPVVMAN